MKQVRFIASRLRNHSIMANRELAQQLREIGLYLEMENVPFKPRAYEKAADAVERMEDDVRTLFDRGGFAALEAIPGVGKSIAEKIHEYLSHGTIREHSRLKRRTPVDLTELTALEGVGPKMVNTLYRRLKIKTVQDLERAARAHKVRRLPGFRERTEQNILRSIGFQRQHNKRFLLGDVLSVAQKITAQLESHPAITQVVVGGSVRRWKETIGDIDILLTTTSISDAVHAVLALPEIGHVYGKGRTKIATRLTMGIDMDVRIVPEQSFGAALQYDTGNRAHNIRLRERAKKRGWMLNEYGLFRGKRRLAGRTEDEVYQALGLDWMPPELRTDHGEIEAAERHALPALIEQDDLRGDLQVQTDWTDGADSIVDMAAAAKRAGLSYIAVTDHTKSLAMTHGSDEKKLGRQMRAIDALNRRLHGFRVLKGAEVNIKKDGSLDISRRLLAKLDVAGIAVHSHFHLTRAEMTKRILTAMRTPEADILFHPTGRVINSRPPYDVDMEALFHEARQTRTVFEIDAFPTRLDLHDELIRRGRELGMLFALDSDAHARSQFAFLAYGVGQARRGWLEPRHVLNTLTQRSLASVIRRHRDKRRISFSSRP